MLRVNVSAQMSAFEHPSLADARSPSLTFGIVRSFVRLHARAQGGGCYVSHIVRPTRDAIGQHCMCWSSLDSKW